MIAYAMLYTVAVGLPTYLAAAVGATFLRRHGRAERGVWLAALVMVLALPAIMLSRPPIAVPTPWTPVLESVAIDLAPVVIVPAVTEAAPLIGIEDILIALWLLASLALTTRWVVSSVRLAGLGRSWNVDTLGGVRVSLSLGTGPGVFGIVRPRIVVPSWVATLPDPQRALVLRHEQEHLRGGDHWLAAIGRAARILTPWHPLVWLLTSRLGRAMELDCDRRVLRCHPDVATYGNTLLLVSARGSHEILASAAFAESDVSLRRRILAMTAPPRTVSAVGLVAAIAVGVVLLTGALEVPVPAVGAPVPRLDRLFAAPPVPVDARSALPSTAPAPVASPEALPPTPKRVISAEQTPPRALPEPTVISDPRRGRISLYLLPGEVNAPRPDQLGYGIVAADGGVLVGGSSGSAAVPYLADDRLRFVTVDEVNPGLLQAPFPGGPPREITEGPQILNPDEVWSAVAEAYPPELQARGMGGTVAVQFLVGEAGEVRDTRVGQLAAYPQLTSAALRAASAYRFSPARAGDDYVAVWVRHAIDFRAP